MEVVIRPIAHGSYAPFPVDAISCTYNMDGFTPMNAVLSAYGMDREHFRKCARFHAGPKFRTICHGDCYERPQVITVSKTERWDSEPSATDEILTIADCERCESLCMTHFMFIIGKFPETAFEQCLRSVELAKLHTRLRKIVVDVDERCYLQALDVHNRVRKNVISGLCNSRTVNGVQHSKTNQNRCESAHHENSESGKP